MCVLYLLYDHVLVIWCCETISKIEFENRNIVNYLWKIAKTTILCIVFKHNDMKTYDGRYSTTDLI